MFYSNVDGSSQRGIVLVRRPNKLIRSSYFEGGTCLTMFTPFSAAVEVYRHQSLWTLSMIQT